MKKYRSTFSLKHQPVPDILKKQIDDFLKQDFTLTLGDFMKAFEVLTTGEKDELTRVIHLREVGDFYGL